MAEIKNFLSPEAIKQQDDYIKKLELIKAGYEATAKSSMQLLTNIEKIQVTTKNTSETQKKLNKTTSEAAKLQKQYETNTEKLRIVQGNYSKAVIRTRMELQENTKEIKRNITIAKAQEGAYNKINAALLKNIDKWKKLSQEERENTAAGRQLTKTIQQQDAQLKKLDSQIGRSQRNVGNYGTALRGVASSLLGAFGVVGGIAMFAQVLKSAFSTIRTFTKENAILAGVLGTTREQVKDLTDQAIQLGSIYPVTASEVNKLQVSYARLGFTQAEILSLTESTILGSIALNASLDETATLVGAVVRAYDDLNSTDSARIIDALTTSTQKSSLSFESLNTALPKVAAAANAMNVPLEQTLALLGVANDATLDASISGTSLRNIFLELEKQGLTLNEAIDKINGSQDKLTTAYDLFGKRAAIVALAIANNKDRVEELTVEISSLQSAAKTAEEQMKTLDGSINAFRSSWEKAVLSLRGSENVIGNVIDGHTNKVNALTDEYATLSERLLLFSGVTGKVVAWYNEMIRGEENSVKVAEESVNARYKLLKEVENATAKEAIHFININRAKAEDGNKFAKAMIEAAERRLDTLAKLDEEARTREKKREDERKLEKIQIESEIAELARTQYEKDVEAVNNKYNEMLVSANKYKIDTTEIENARARDLAAIESKRTEKQREEDRKRVEEFIKMTNELRKKEREIRKEQIDNYKEDIKSANELELDKLKELNADKIEIAEVTYKNEVKARIEANEEIVKEAEKRAEKEKEIEEWLKEAKYDLAVDGVNALFELNSVKFEKQLSDLEAERELVLSNENLTAEERQRIEEDYDRKQSEIKSKQAKNDKTAALFEVAIQTAIGAAKAVAESPLTFGLPFLPFVIAQGALQAALIAAQPIPQFAKGTDYAPEMGLFGEKGAELMRTVAGSLIYASQPTLFSGSEYRGAKIWDAKETEQILSNGIVRGRNVDELINLQLIKGYNKGFETMANEYRKGNKQVVRAIKDNNRTRNYNNTLETRSGNTIKRYHNQFN